MDNNYSECWPLNTIPILNFFYLSCSLLVWTCSLRLIRVLAATSPRICAGSCRPALHKVNVNIVKFNAICIMSLARCILSLVMSPPSFIIHPLSCQKWLIILCSNLGRTSLFLYLVQNCSWSPMVCINFHIMQAYAK